MRTNRLPLNKLGGLGILSLMAKAISFAPPQSEALERRDNESRTQRPRDVEADPALATGVYELGERTRALERNVPYPYY